MSDSADETVPVFTGLTVADIFPPIEKLDFSKDCEAYGRWLMAYFAPDPWTPTDALGGSISLSLGLLQIAIPDDWLFPADMVDNTTIFYARMMDWWVEKLYFAQDNESLWIADKGIETYAVIAPSDKCGSEFCKAMAWTGNGDMTGIGVFISYYLEACLATLYLIAFTVWHLRRHYEKKRVAEANMIGGEAHIQRTFTEHSSGWHGRVLDAFRGSIDALLGATVLMGLVMIVAAIYTSAQKSRARVLPQSQKEIPTGSAIYDILLSLLAATFGAFPVMTIYALMRQPDRAEVSHRRWLRRTSLALVWILGVAEVFLAPRGDLDYDDRHDADYQGYDCDQRGGTAYWAGLKASQFLVIGVPLAWIFITVFLVTGFWIPGVAEAPFVRRWRAMWRLLVAWVNLILMWGVLGYFTMLRHKIIETSDGLDKNDEWSFGQILAVSTWIPSIAEFLYILVFGLEDSLQGRMPENYKVSRFNPFSRQEGSFNVPLMKGPRHGSSGSITYSGKEGDFILVQNDATPQSPPAEPYEHRSHISHAGNTNSWDTRVEDPDSQTPWKQLQSTGW